MADVETIDTESVPASWGVMCPEAAEALDCGMVIRQLPPAVEVLPTPKKPEPVDPSLLTRYLMRQILRVPSGKVVSVDYQTVSDDSYSHFANKGYEVLLRCTDRARYTAQAENGSKVSEVILADAQEVFTGEPEAPDSVKELAGELDGSSQSDRWRSGYELAGNVDFLEQYYGAEYINRELSEREKRGAVLVAKNVYLRTEDRLDLAKLGIVMRRVTPHSNVQEVVRDFKAAAAVIRRSTAATREPGKAAKVAMEKARRKAAKGVLPRGAIVAALRAARFCVVIAQEKAQRANDDGGGACVLDAEVMGSPIRYAGLAWKRVQSWEKMTPEKFREYKKLASLAKGKAKDSQTKLACKMWAKTGAKTR